MPEQQNQQPPADWKNLEVHPIAQVFPPMSDDEYRALKQDILERGPQEPILLYEGKILDGKARRRACKELDIEPQFVNWEGDQDTLTVWLQVKGKNLIRQHLSAESRVAVLLLSAQTFPEVAQTIEAIVGAAQMRQQLGLKFDKKSGQVGEAASLIGAMVGASRSTVRRVSQVQEQFPQRLKELAEGKTTCSRILMPTAPASTPAPANNVAHVKKYQLIYADITDDKLAKTLPARMDAKCAVFLWAPPGRLQSALKVLLGCGLLYQAMVVWDKGGDAELLLMATKNCPGFPKIEKVVIKDKAPKGGGKPELFRELAVYLFPQTEGKRLDLFTPAEVEGWDRIPEPAPIANQ